MENGRRPEAIDTRLVFRMYAALACAAGLVIFGWVPLLFDVHLAEQPYGKAALVRVLGAFMMAAAFCAAGFAAVDHPPARRRGLFWFAVAHGVVCLVAVLQQIAIWESPAIGRALQVLSAVTILLFYLWATSEGEYPRRMLASLFSGATPDSPERLRSQYEQQIRAAARQEERTRLARDLHDAIKQQIFVVQTAAATVEARLDTDTSGAREAAGRVRTAAREAMAEMEAMLDQLRAAPLGNAGLIESLKKQCEALEARTGARVEFKLGNLPRAEALAPGSHEAILRVAQEALANIGRHARAKLVLVSLNSLPEQVELTIRDNGAGFDTNGSRRGQGIANMRARAEEFGGSFELTSLPGAGTAVVFRLPSVAGDTAAEYRRRAIVSGLLLVFVIPVVVSEQSPTFAAMTLLTAAGVARYTVAYRRAKAAGL